MGQLLRQTAPAGAADQFGRDGYLVLRGVLATTALFDYAQSIKQQGDLGDPQVPGTPSFYRDPVFAEVHRALLPLVEAATGIPLFVSYNYFRIYKRGDILRCHTDRPACEISATVHIGGTTPWPISLMDRNERPVEILLDAGDMLLYRGAELFHWRARFEGSDDYVQAFLHYVDRNGDFADQREDGRERLNRAVDALRAQRGGE